MKDDKDIRKQKTIKEEHITMIDEPGSTFIGHVSTGRNETSKATFEKKFEYLETKKLDLSLLRVVGCDGMIVNTGKHSGVVRLLDSAVVCSFIGL